MSTFSNCMPRSLQGCGLASTCTVPSPIRSGTHSLGDGLHHPYPLEVQTRPYNPWACRLTAALFGGILTTPDSNTWSASYDAPHPLSILACARAYSFARGTLLRMQSCSGTCKSCSGTCKSCSGTCPGVPELSYATVPERPSS